MSTNAIETRKVPVDVTTERGGELDQTAVDILKTVYVATEMLGEINEAIEAGKVDLSAPPSPLTKDYVDALEEAIECFQTIAARDDYEAFLQDVSTLDAELLAEIRGTIVYVGHHFGIDIALPTPDGGGA
jgi:hypothetical protein